MSNIDYTMERLENQISWYDSKSINNQRTFKLLKIVEIGAAALVPVSATMAMPTAITASLGILITLLEGLQHLNQYQHNWITYRSTCESLKHEKYLYLAKAGPYASSNDPHVLLAERVESLVSQEHKKWITGKEHLTKAKEA